MEIDWDEINPMPGFGYYDRQGNPISLRQWSELHSNMKYKRVAEDTIGQLWVSTVWLGMDHGMPFDDDYRREIFETMVFGRDGGKVDWGEFDCARYTTEAEAIAGHEAICAALRVQHSDIVGGEESSTTVTGEAGR